MCSVVHCAFVPVGIVVVVVAIGVVGVVSGVVIGGVMVVVRGLVIGVVMGGVFGVVFGVVMAVARVAMVVVVVEHATPICVFVWWRVLCARVGFVCLLDCRCVCTCALLCV